MLLLDTHALIWWTLKPQQLSRRAREACDRIRANGAFVSSISFWEIAVKIKKGRLDLGLSMSEFIERTRLANVAILAVDEHAWVQSVELDWNHRDPADRTIVATARLRKLPIVTADKRIKRFHKSTIW